MKKIIYIFMVLSLSLGFCNCGGSGGDDPEPVKPAGPAKVEFALKSGIGSLDDAGLEGIISHVRLYVFDQAGKLLKNYKYNSVADIKSVELEEGNYTVVFVGNVPLDENISGETEGMALVDMKIQLTKKNNSDKFTPLGDVLFAKNTLTVGEADVKAELSVKRTLSTTKINMTDNSGKIAEAGVLIPDVGTTLSFGDTEWEKPGMVFVTMTKGGVARNISRADYTSTNYWATVKMPEVAAREGTTRQDSIQTNTFMKDFSNKTVFSQIVAIPVNMNPDMEVVMDMTVDESHVGDEQLSLIEYQVKIKDLITGKIKSLSKDEVTIRIPNVPLNISPGDWETGSSEDVEIK